MSHSLIFSVALAVCIGGVAPAAVLELEIVDEQDRPVAARVLLRPSDKACLVPDGAVVLAVGEDRWFMSDGKTPALTSIETPAGVLTVRVEKGPEYVRYKRRIEVAPGNQRLRVVLRRWIDMKDRGYLCGENHLHVDPSQLGPMLVVEDLDFGTVLHWWNDRRLPTPPGSGHVRTLSFAGKQIPTSVYDAEVEREWGAVYLLNLPAANPIPEERSLPNLAHVKHAREVGGLVCYQAGWSREVLLDALLGYVDVVNVCNNNWHLHRFQPRRRYSNLLEVDDFPVYENTPEDMLRMNTETYYRLLNMGLPLAAGAGSATGVKQTPVGYNRAYVRCGPDDTIETFYQRWAEGKNFVTNGPMLFLRTADGKQPGDRLALPAGGGAVEFVVAALSDQPLTELELIVNGEVVRQFASDDSRKARGRATLRLERSSWVAARCLVRDEHLTDEELATYAAGDQQQPTRLRFAHTSPIYVHVDEQPIAVRQSIEEGLQMLAALKRFAAGEVQADYVEQFQQALADARRELESRLEGSY